MRVTGKNASIVLVQNLQLSLIVCILEILIFDMSCDVDVYCVCVCVCLKASLGVKCGEWVQSAY
jgi:hypothetical protein